MRTPLLLWQAVPVIVKIDKAMKRVLDTLLAVQDGHRGLYCCERRNCNTKRDVDIAQFFVDSLSLVEAETGGFLSEKGGDYE